MAQLFQALQSESAGSSGSTSDSGTSAPGGRFAAALSSLSTDVANGSAPDGLQSAYAQLMQDLQGSTTGSSTAGDGASSSSSSASPPDLQAFLSTLQQNLAQYGQPQMALGNVVSTQA